MSESFIEALLREESVGCAWSYDHRSGASSGLKRRDETRQRKGLMFPSGLQNNFEKLFALFNRFFLSRFLSCFFLLGCHDICSFQRINFRYSFIVHFGESLTTICSLSDEGDEMQIKNAIF